MWVEAGPERSLRCVLAALRCVRAYCLLFQEDNSLLTESRQYSKCGKALMLQLSEVERPTLALWKARQLQSVMDKRRTGQIVVLVLLALFLLAPVYECFDHWDGFPRSGDDTALSLIATVTFCGVVLLAARSLLRVFTQKRFVKLELWEPPCARFALLGRKAADESPPLSFPLSLRV